MGLLDSIMGAGGGDAGQGGNQTKALLLAGLLAMLASRQGSQNADGSAGGGGLLGSLGSMLGGGAAAGGAGGLGGLLGGLLGGQNAQGGAPAQGAGPTDSMVGNMGGLGGLTQMLQNAGLGNAVQSWIGTGANESVSPDQIGQALDQGGHLQQLADAAGISKEEASQHLAELLPQVVDKLTPNGDVPAEQMNLAGLAAHFLGK